jgi:hypothetical protein
MAALKNDARKAIRFWVHEAMRAFGDRLCERADMELLHTRLEEIVLEKYRENL